MMEVRIRTDIRHGSADECMSILWKSTSFIMKRYLVLWFPMIILAVVNGTLRDLGYKPYLGELAAHQVSTLTLVILLGIYIRWVMNRFPPANAQQAWLTGVVWLALTLLFEFGLGFARGRTIHELLHDYALLQGRIWIIIPVWTFMAPRWFYRPR